MRTQTSSPTARRTILLGLSFGVVLPILLTLLFAPIARADLKHGQDLFERRCTGCHRLDEVRIGPRLRGVFGRAAGSDPGFPYSAALKSSHITWNESTLDRWLADPERIVPDNDMGFRVTKADERTEIIAYVKSLSTR